MDLKNLYFFRGENTYALSKEILRWKGIFTEKHGPENLLVLQAPGKTVSDLLDAVSVMPFIAEKRLVILEGLPKIEKEDFQRVIESIHPQTVLAIVESKPDKRLGILKHIEKTAEGKSFPLLSPAELLQWVQKTVHALGSTINSDAEKLLLSIVGTDQWMLESELEKLSALSKGEIGIREVETLAVPSGDQIVWQLTDLIGSGKATEAHAFFVRRIERGEDAYGLWTILLSMIKNLTLVVASVDAGITNERSIATSTGLYFMQVRGLLPLAKSIGLARMRALVAMAADADIQLKSGGYHYSADRPGEVIALSERMILMTNPHS